MGGSGRGFVARDRQALTHDSASVTLEAVALRSLVVKG